MVKIDLQLFGGRGSSSGRRHSGGALAAFKSNAKQFNNALHEGRKRSAAIVEYTDLYGKIHKRYWNGVTYTDRKSSLFTNGDRYAHKGVYQAKYKE